MRKHEKEGYPMLDSIDKTILRKLQGNAKISVKELSSQISMSQPAVSERIRKLEKNGFIDKYTIKLNSKKLGKNFACFCFVVLKSSSESCEKNFREFVKNSKEIQECYCLAGPYEYVVKIITESSETLEDILIQMRRQSVVRTYTHPVLTTVKDDFGYDI
jgi:Transcriptional regulators